MDSNPDSWWLEDNHENNLEAAKAFLIKAIYDMKRRRLSENQLLDEYAEAICSGLLNAGYLDTRRALIDPAAAMARPKPGAPPQTAGRSYGDDQTIEAAGTSHFSIVDGDGNMLAMTTTIEAGFGSRLWAAGFLLNNELTDFSFRPVDRAGRPVANAVAGTLKR